MLSFKKNTRMVRETIPHSCLALADIFTLIFFKLSLNLKLLESLPVQSDHMRKPVAVTREKTTV